MSQVNEVLSLILKEKERQNNQIELIASENIVSMDVLLAMGSVLTNKYAEGYPGKRYYGGCEFADMIEDDARRSACALFGCQYANVQPHSGAQANLSVLYALLRPGDALLGMDLSSGGHLTHGAKPTISGKWFNASCYSVDPKTFLIDYDVVEKLAHEHKPKLIICGASAYPRVIDFKRFREIADSVGAYLMADVAHYAGLIAAGEYPTPFPYAHVVTSTTHKTLRGPRGGIILTNDKEISEKIDKAVFPGVQGGPLMHVIAGKAVALREALQDSFKEYARQVIKNAKALSGRLQQLGYSVLSGGTDSHIVILDLRNTGITGADAEKSLERAGMTCNKNTIPFDPLPVKMTSGVRLGTPAGTTRGMNEHDFEVVAECIAKVLKGLQTCGSDNRDAEWEVKAVITKMCGGLSPIPSLI